MPLFSMSSKKEKEELTKLSAEFDSVKTSNSLMKCLKSLQKIAQSRGFFSNLIKRSDRGMLGARKILDKIFGIKGDRNPNKVEIMNAGIQVKNVMFKTTRGATKIIGKSIKTALENLLYISLNSCAISLYAVTRAEALRPAFTKDVKKKIETWIDTLMEKRNHAAKNNIDQMINSLKLNDTIEKYFENLIIKYKATTLWTNDLLEALEKMVHVESKTIGDKEKNKKAISDLRLFIDNMFFHMNFLDVCKKDNFYTP